MKYSNKRIPVKKLKHYISTEVYIHPKLKSDSDISSKEIDDIIEKKCGKNIDKKVPRSCIPTIVEDLFDEKDNE